MHLWAVCKAFTYLKIINQAQSHTLDVVRSVIEEKPFFTAPEDLYPPNPHMLPQDCLLQFLGAERARR